MSLLRSLPSIDRLLSDPSWGEGGPLPHSVRRAACRAVVDALRAGILDGTVTELPEDAALVARAVASARAAAGPRLVRVVNGTGVLLHTNLGRAPLAEAALDALSEVAGRYTNLELDLQSGRRDSRHTRLSEGFARVIGCADVVVANNNAAAVFLALSALAAGEDVVVSRGELVEIGGSFRMPEIMESSGARLREVGATNRTHLRDYAAALDTGAKVVMKVHRSNFAQLGFVSEVSIEELGALCRERGALLLHDLGMGVLDGGPGVARVDGGSPESVRRSLDAGAHVVLFSGDKMLGGPQAGILAGDADVLARVGRHPVMRLVRPGKLCLLALEATLRLWELDPSGGLVPAARLLTRSADALRVDAAALAARLPAALQPEVVPSASTPGGGSLPGSTVPSWAVAVRHPTLGEDALAAALRAHRTPVVPRIEDGRVRIDLRTLLDGDADVVVDALESTLR